MGELRHLFPEMPNGYSAKPASESQRYDKTADIIPLFPRPSVWKKIRIGLRAKMLSAKNRTNIATTITLDIDRYNTLTGLLSTLPANNTYIANHEQQLINFDTGSLIKIANSATEQSILTHASYYKALYSVLYRRLYKV